MPTPLLRYTDGVSLPDVPPFPVLAHFGPHVRGLSWQRTSGGFSGACVWRGADSAPRVALKGWPPDISSDRLQQIHAQMTAARGLSFVPEVLPGAGGRTVFFDGARVWDCCMWMPGEPCSAPTHEEIARACEAVACLHAVWAPATTRGECPCVRNRLRILAENEPLLRAGPSALPHISAQLDPLLRRAVTVAARAAPGAVEALREWEPRALALQPCVRDLRSAHVLFSARAVTGIIDFGAAVIDHPASDLARLLDDYTSTEEPGFTLGLGAYRAPRPAFDVPNDFVRLLAHTGRVCSVLGWLVRLVVRREPFADAGAIGSRLALLVARSEQFPHM